MIIGALVAGKGIRCGGEIGIVDFVYYCQYFVARIIKVMFAERCRINGIIAEKHIN